MLKLNTELKGPDGTPGSCDCTGCCPSTDQGGATGDLHVHHAGGGRTDIKGIDGGIFNMHQAANISINARFTYANFTLAPEDPRSLEVREVQGSFLTKAYAQAQTSVGGVAALVTVEYGSERPFMAHVRVKTSVDRLNEQKWIGKEDGPIVVGDVEVEMRPGTPVELAVSDGRWLYSIKPGTYNTAADGARKTRIDVAVTALTNPLAAAVAPHGILGQGFDGRHIEGAKDNYVPDAKGVFVTSAQGEGAIEGKVEDYLVDPTNPFSTSFKFGRFDKTTAPPRDTSRLSKELALPSGSSGQRGMQAYTAGDGFATA
jgi:hypothetical protein